MSKKRRGHKGKPRSPSHKSNGAKFKDDRQQGSSRGSATTNSAKGTEYEDTPTGDNSSWGKGKVLKDIENPSEVKKDLALIGRALKGRWNIPDRRKIDIQERLFKVAEKETVSIATKDGPVEAEEPADRNAVAAIKVLVQMQGQDIECDQFEVKNGKPSTPGTVVNVFPNSAEPGASRILQLAKSLGARELVIDGSAISVTDSVGESKEA